MSTNLTFHLPNSPTALKNNGRLAQLIKTKKEMKITNFMIEFLLQVP